MRVRVYIKPFLFDGTYASSFTEVTEDVDEGSLSQVKQSIDIGDYSLGLFKYSSLNLKLNNIHGKYSEVGVYSSIFAYKRNDSIVKVTWDLTDDFTQCGTAIAGSCYLQEETTIYLGLLNDESLSQKINEQKLNFKVFGYESILSRVETPYTSINNGDNISDVIKTCLNQSAITALLTYSVGNIVVGNDNTIDDKTDLENTTVKEALDILLPASSSVFYIKDSTMYVSDTTATVAVQQTFYGQASESGIENIADIYDIRDGLNRAWNYWTWEDTSNIAKDTSAITQYGVKKREINYSLITNSTKIDDILGQYQSDYSTPKKTFYFVTPITYDSISRELLDRIAIDYPTVFRAVGTEGLPLYDVAIYDSSFYGREDYSLTIPTSDNFKILEKNIDLKNHNIIFKVRLI